MRKTTGVAIAGMLAILLAACTSPGAAPISASPSVAPSVGPSVAPSEALATPEACAKDSLTLVTAGTFTIGTDNPAYPPYFLENTDGSKTAPWELGDPTNATGFESAVGYAIADQLGFSREEVTWVVVPFANAFAPGPKTFDIDLNQVTDTPERRQTVDLTKGYYFGRQSLVAMEGTPIAAVSSTSSLKDYTFGAQVGTTSLDAINTIIQPTKAAQVYDTNDAAIQALGQGTIDGVVVDLPTADYITNVQLDGSTIVGQFKGGTPEHFSAVLAKDSSLTPCVEAAIDVLINEGTLEALASQFLPFQDAVPVFGP
ncbi:MAG TPA: transporter substrate-binding domain-containing protein [Candidatus Limnocylindrales bacterium]|nr:transporter substrate-binding domain-containing protein [Candidatus Limnocylindrales bacterium]